MNGADYFKANLHLQVIGRWAGDGGLGPLEPLGPRVFLQAGTFTEASDALGVVNLDPVPLPEVLLGQRWILHAYELWDHPDCGEKIETLRLSYGQEMTQLRYVSLPPCAIRPQQEVQPLFELGLQERNPCPGWTQRVHLYRMPNEPFTSTAVIYMDKREQIAAAELFAVPLRYYHAGVARRCWIRFFT